MRTYGYPVILIFLFFPLAFSGFSQNPDIYKSDAIRYEWDQDYEKAAGLYEKAALLYEQDGKIDTMCFYKAGQSYVRDKQFSKAVPMLKRAVALKWPEADGHLYLAEALYETGQHEEARQVLDEGIKKFPGQESAFLGKMARLDYEAEQFDAALEAVNQALENKNTVPLLDLKARILEKSGRHDEAAHVYRALVKARPEDSNYQLRLGFMLFKKADNAYKEEMQRYKGISNPSRVQYSESRKRLLKIAGGFKEATPHLEAALEQQPGSKPLMQALYISYKRLGNKTEEQKYKSKLGL